MLKETFAVLAAIALVVGFVIAMQLASLENYKFFGPKFEDARRNVFEETKSYQDGLRRDFDNLYLQYEEAKDPDEKSAILSVIRHRAEGVNPDFLPTSIRNLLRI